MNNTTPFSAAQTEICKINGEPVTAAQFLTLVKRYRRTQAILQQTTQHKYQQLHLRQLQSDEETLNDILTAVNHKRFESPILFFIISLCKNLETLMQLPPLIPLAHLSQIKRRHTLDKIDEDIVDLENLVNYRYTPKNTNDKYPKCW